MSRVAAKGKPRGRNGGRPPRLNWPGIVADLRAGYPLWRAMADHDVDRQVLANGLRRRGVLLRQLMAESTPERRSA